MALVLIGCEVSGVVRDEFRKAGHEAYSCDVQKGEGLHIQGDVVDAIKSRRWRFIGLHPPCTALAVSGNAHYAKGKAKHAARIGALDWTSTLWDLARNCATACYLENPVGVLSRRIGKPTQTIQPHQFGHDASKATCLWLHGLPPLQPTGHVAPRLVSGKPRWGNQTDSGQNRLGPSPTRAAERARTYQGIAAAMAEQWGPLL